AAGVGATLPNGAPSFLGLVLKHWVEDQRKFFDKNTQRDHNNLKRFERRVDGVFIFGLVFAIAVALLHYKYHASWVFQHWHHRMIVIMGTAPAIAAALGGYIEKMAFSAQAKRYRWMNGLFTRGSTQLQAYFLGGMLNEAQQLILDLGKEALEENGEW